MSPDGSPQAACLIRGSTIAGGFLVWLFAWDNARTLPALRDAGWTTLLPIPSSVRFLEVALVGCLFVATIVQARRWHSWQRTGLGLLFCFFLFSLTSITVSVLSGLSFLISALQTVYFLASPLLVVAIIGLRSVDRDAPNRFLRVLIIAISINVLAAWWQVVREGVSGDDVHGLMRDAHHFASAAWIGILWFVARLSAGIGSRRWNVVGIVTFFIAALEAANEKANIAAVAVLGLAAAIILWRRALIYRVIVVSGVVGGVVMLRAVALGQVPLPKQFGHIPLVLQHLSGIGFFEGYRKMAVVSLKYPRVFAVGTGPASYGSIKAVDAVTIGGELPPLAAEYTAESYRLIHMTRGLLGSYLEESTDLSAAFVELGPIALLLLAAAVWQLAVRPARRAARSSDPRTVALGRWLLLSIGFVGMMSAFSAFFGWSGLQTTVWAIMIAAGLLQGTWLTDGTEAPFTEVASG